MREHKILNVSLSEIVEIEESFFGKIGRQLTCRSRYQPKTILLELLQNSQKFAVESELVLTQNLNSLRALTEQSQFGREFVQIFDFTVRVLMNSNSSNLKIGCNFRLKWVFKPIY